MPCLREGGAGTSPSNVVSKVPLYFIYTHKMVRLFGMLYILFILKFISKAKQKVKSWNAISSQILWRINRRLASQRVDRDILFFTYI